MASPIQLYELNVEVLVAGGDLRIYELNLEVLRLPGPVVISELSAEFLSTGYVNTKINELSAEVLYAAPIVAQPGQFNELSLEVLVEGGSFSAAGIHVQWSGVELFTALGTPVDKERVEWMGVEVFTSLSNTMDTRFFAVNLEVLYSVPAPVAADSGNITVIW